MQFSWDPRKAAANARKHDVTFDEALTVFHDDLARIHDDPEHSIDELREVIIGVSAAGRVVLVCFAERGDTVRIINAREPDAMERHDYEENL